ncbi:glycosyltransferase family 2 protein [uncultured Bacteroides sp.]|uniref:glycosyltransferase family 2 protein n=1 Tax=uncultured Bacteroides sp. TaxID=162156 RepID=UPI002AABDE79|nr:glycosyltransferase family 2 protein [uncultured Bacteroides sp.]
MNNLPELSIITVNYNGLKDTSELIKSLQTHISLSYEIIVVDNASKVNEAALLQEKYPHIITIRSEENLGFSGGNNLGIHQAKGKYIFLLNNDTFIEEDTFHYLIERLKSSSEIGAVSPKIKFAFPPRNIQFAGYLPLSAITLRNDLIGFGEKDDGQYEISNRTPYCHGAAMMIKKEVIETVGYMPEIYFLYYEELDWCTQITKAGYELWYEPRCTVYHKESQSTGQQSYMRTFYLTRNRLLYAWRNRDGVIRWISILYQLLVAAPKNSLVFLLRGRTYLAKAVFKGIIAFIKLEHKLS